MAMEEVWDEMDRYSVGGGRKEAAWVKSDDWI